MSGGNNTPRRLVVVASDTTNCRTFIFKGEGHTLGNTLKNIILQNPEVTFCGYSVPHPMEDQMFLRVQTVAGVAAEEALRRGLQDLRSACDVVKAKFQEEVNASQCHP